MDYAQSPIRWLITSACMCIPPPGKPAPLVDGQTPEQRFFTANAVVWRGKQRVEALVDQLRTDGHSPGRWRVNGLVVNFPEFEQAFACKPTARLVKPERQRCTLW